MVSEAAAAVPPVAGGAVLTALPSALQDLARCFLSLSGSSSLWQLEALREWLLQQLGRGVLCAHRLLLVEQS